MRMTWLTHSSCGGQPWPVTVLMVSETVEQVIFAQSPAVEAGAQQGCALEVKEDHSQCLCCSSEEVLAVPS